MRFHEKCFLPARLSVIAFGTSRAKGQEPAAPPMKQGEQQKPETGNAAGEKRALVKEGTEVHLKLAQTMTSKTSTVGEPVEMVLAEDLKVGENVVVRKGVRVLGTDVAGKKKEKNKYEARSLRVVAGHNNIAGSVIEIT